MAQKSPYEAALESNDKDLLARMTDTRSLALTDGALPKKVKLLMMMLCDSLLNHENGVKNLANMARDAGASEEEIKETLRVCFLMGGLPGLVTGVNAYKS